MNQDEKNLPADAPLEDQPKSKAPFPEEPSTTVEINGNTYYTYDVEIIKQQLRQGNVAQNLYIESLELGNPVDAPKALYAEKLLFKNCVIGRIDFAGAVFEEMIKIDKSVFEGKVEINSNAIFKNALSFDSCIFKQRWEGRSPILRDRLLIINSQLMAEFVLEDATLGGACSFTQSKFEKQCNIKRCIFKDAVTAHGTFFYKEFHWRQNQFYKRLRLRQAKFFGYVQFAECTVSEDAFFDMMEAEDRFDLQGNSFFKRTVFTESIFRHKLVAKNCVFEKHSTWSKTIFQQHAAFFGSRFESGVVFDGAQFEAQAYFEETFLCNSSFNGTHFAENVSFERAKATGEFLFYGVLFDKDVSFTFCEVDGRASFSNQVKFGGKADFYRATFKGSVWFLGTHFQEVSFTNTTFEAQVFFSFDKNTLRERNRRKKGKQKDLALRYISVFHGETNFTNTLFYRKAVFENVFFKEFANFENASFAEEINFENSHFLKGATFQESFCSQELNFAYAVFDDYVNFDLANINRRLNLTDATIDRGISFYHAVIDVVVVERDQIEGRLVYEGNVSGQEYRVNPARVKEEYLTLQESFHQRGKFEEEDWAYYRYRVNERKSITRKAWNSLYRRLPKSAEDAPKEEWFDEKDLLAQVEKSSQNAHKKLLSQQNKLEKLQEKEQHFKEQEKPGKVLAKIRREIEQAKKLCDEKHEKFTRLQQEENLIRANIEMNRQRLQKLHESKEKPYSKLEAVLWVFRNIGWILVDWGTGYGMKPFRIGFLAVSVILLFAGIYSASGAVYPGEQNTFMNWVYFSAMAFATSSPEGDIAYDDTIKFFVMSEAMIGLFLLALFVGCYTRKIIR